MPCGCVLIAYLGLSTIWDGSARTLRFQIDGWQNQSWGLHAIDRQRIRCEVAVASDGSRMNRCEYELFHHYFFPDGRGMDRNLYLRSENAGFHIDDTTRMVRGGPCSCTWKPVSALADDNKCRRTAEARLSEGKSIGTGQIAGYEVVQYRAVDEKGAETRLSLAPGLACEVMEEIHTSPGTLGIPGAKWQYRVTSYKPGEPDRNAFRLPVGYTVQQKTE
jgi:hypothetical protein